MLQQQVADDFVIATGVQYSVRQFVEFAAAELGVSLRWLMTGEGGLAEAPPTGGPLPQEARQVREELAQMRVEMLALVGRMGDLEGRLRTNLDTGRP